jgi:hypothetical protein
MNTLDTLPPVVRNAVHEATAYTDTAHAAELVKIYGPDMAAKMILARREPD